MHMPCTWLGSCACLYAYNHMRMQARVKREEAAANELKLAQTTAKVSEYNERK